MAELNTVPGVGAAWGEVGLKLPFGAANIDVPAEGGPEVDSLRLRAVVATGAGP